jgi:hypothetical protein
MVEDPDEMTRKVSANVRRESGPRAVDPDRLREQIGATRKEMSETIDAIQERLDPGRLVTEATRLIKGAAVGRARNLADRANSTATNLAAHPRETGAQFVNAVTSSPFRATLAGFAASWLVGRALRRHGYGSRSGRRIARFLMTAAAAAAYWGLRKIRQSSSHVPPPPGDEGM